MSTRTDSISREGIHKCGILFEKLGFCFREQPILDYGIDAIIETKDDNYMLGKMIAVQIKSGESYFKEADDNYVVFRGNLKHYNYWLNHSLPVIIVLYSPMQDTIIWEVFNTNNVIRSNNGWKMKIPKSQTLNNAKYLLEDIAKNQSLFERRWNSLVVAKQWMIETKKRGQLILEVEEWLNKSSGRGKFILKSQEHSKEEVLFCNEFFGFGTKDYKCVIQELFPWADINVDEIFYDYNMDEECEYRKTYTDRQSAFDFGKRGAELLQYSDDPPKIYPYKNGAGEVEFYRLILTLNEVGESFLKIDNFLDTGKFYLIDRIVE